MAFYGPHVLLNLIISKEDQAWLDALQKTTYDPNGKCRKCGAKMRDHIVGPPHCPPLVYSIGTER